VAAAEAARVARHGSRVAIAARRATGLQPIDETDVEVV
jgi:hypothetical protein